MCTACVSIITSEKLNLLCLIALNITDSSVCVSFSFIHVNSDEVSGNSHFHLARRSLLFAQKGAAA